MARKAFFHGLQQWDNVKLTEVWGEFCWHLAREGVVQQDMLSVGDQAIYQELRNELLRRGMQLRWPYGSWSS
jgi:hypothetical protein